MFGNLRCRGRELVDRLGEHDSRRRSEKTERLGEQMVEYLGEEIDIATHLVDLQRHLILYKML